jgi:hypothetical protein
MTTVNRSIRLIANSSTVLDKKTGEVGEIFYDNTNQTIRIMDGSLRGGRSLASQAWVNDNTISQSELTTALNPYVTDIELTETLTSYVTSLTLASYTDTVDMNSAISTAISDLLDAAPPALDTLNELAAALGDDANYASTITTALSAKAPLASPSFTGHITVEGVTATGATGTGKIVFDTTPTISGVTLTGATTIQQTVEKFTSTSIILNAVTLDFSSGGIFTLGSNAANITANFTNIPTTAGQTMSVTIIISQGSTAYIPNVLTINSASQTIKWLAGVTPAGYANKTDFVSFTFICTATSSYTVTGSLGTYG